MNPEPVEQVAPAPDAPVPADAPAAPPEAPAEPGADSDPGGPEEVVVWGRLAVDQARDALVRKIETLGYHVARRRAGDVVLKSGDWKGRVFVGPEGDLRFRHPFATLVPAPPEAYTTPPDATASLHAATTVPAGAGVTGSVAGKRQKWGAERAVFDATEGERRRLSAIVERTREEEWLEALPARLDALWSAGTPLRDGDPTVPAADRRAAVLGYWGGLPDDPFGARATDVVERWMEGALPGPFGAEERAAAEAARRDGRTLPASGSDGGSP